MRIAICDDEVKIIEHIKAIIIKVIPEADISSFESGVKLLASMNHNFDVVLLDIDMPGMTGLEVAASMTENERKMLIVFVTAHDELVYDSLKFHPFAFVRKSYLETELCEVLIDCLKEMDSKNRNFTFKADGRNVSIPVNHIIYFEAEANYLILYEKSGEYRFRSTMTGVEKALEQDDFVRIHKGFLVNTQYVRTITSEQITLDNGVVLPVGKTYLDQARTQILRYMRK